MPRIIEPQTGAALLPGKIIETLGLGRFHVGFEAPKPDDSGPSGFGQIGQTAAECEADAIDLQKIDGASIMGGCI